MPKFGDLVRFSDILTESDFPSPVPLFELSDTPKESDAGLATPKECCSATLNWSAFATLTASLGSDNKLTESVLPKPKLNAVICSPIPKASARVLLKPRAACSDKLIISAFGCPA